MVPMEQAEARVPERLSERPVLVAANDQQTAGSMPLPIAADQGLLSRFAEPLRRAAAGDLAISLQSIVSAQGSAAVAYEVHFRLNLSTGESRDFRRLPGIEQAALERLLLVRAADTARAWPSSRRPAPLHVPISDALLSNGLEFAALLTMLSEDPALGDVLVPSMPAACLSAAAGHIQALELLAAAGMLLAIEGRPPVDMPEAIRGTVAYVKLPAGTLLTQPIQPQWGTQLIATDVESEGERARLAALGLKLMTGHAVSGPCSCAMPERQQAAPMVNRL